MEPQDVKSEPKGAKREPKGAKMEPEGCQKETKGQPKCIKRSIFGKGHEKYRFPLNLLVILGSIFHEKSMNE